jgi:exopolysaccharide biosynthesis protein
MLVRDGAPLRDLHDPEGFVAGAHQFDSDITSGRHPRAALGTSDDELIALVCDGRRTGIDVGLTLPELAELMADLGARHAINLDGGGSTALIHHGHLLNRPYDAQDRPSSNSRAVATAALFHTTPAQSTLSGAA